jgi:hypothetical protein
MKILTLPLFLLFCLMGLSSNGQTFYSVTFRLDMNDYNGSYGIPEVNGTFNNWCGSNCDPMSDPDGDEIWEVTVDSLTAGTIEYKFAWGNWTAQESLLPGSTCTQTTGSFTNRIYTVAGNATLPVVCWGSCGPCSGTPSSGTVTFKVDMNGYAGPAFTTVNLNGTFNGWCGSCAPMADPDNDSIYELSVVLPLDTIEYKFTVDGWSGQETLLPGSLCTRTTGTFTNREYIVTGNDTLDAVCWGSCNPCAGGPSSGRVRFRVDMRGYTGLPYNQVNLNGSFNGWCGTCAVMTDANNDSIFEIDVDLPIDTIEYKFTTDGWNVEEILNPGDPCTQTTSTFINRYYIVVGNDTLDAVCWQSCLPCGQASGVGETQPSAVRLYPNPAREFVYLHWMDGGQPDGTLYLCDASGRVIMEKDLSEAVHSGLSTECLSPGLYLVHWTQKQLRGHQRLIIQK